MFVKGGIVMAQKRKLHLSASAIAAFKACPISFKNAYVLGIRPEEDTEARRVGTNWHRLLEVVSMKPGSVCPECAPGDCNDPNCALCDGTGFLPDDIMDAVTRELNRIYEGSYKDPDAIAIERAKLMYMLLGYRWMYYLDDPDVEQEKTITREQHFDLGLINPETGRALPGVKLVGKIDKIITTTGGVLAIKEHKSTSSSLDSDSDYWGHLNLDTQTKLYLYAIRRMQKNGELAPWGVKETDPLISTIKYDVMRKPTIKPKKLSQSDSKKFVETGKYFNQVFDLTYESVPKIVMDVVGGGLLIDGVLAEVTPGAKEGTFAIRETPEMYGARLLADIGERPEFYFRCVEMTRTDKEMEAFEYELFNIYRTMQNMIKTDHWFGNEHHCEAKYKCDYIGVCYNNVEISEGNVPEGFKCIFKKEEE
jgi:hypothetical protein